MAMTSTERQRKRRAKLKAEKRVRLEFYVSPAHAKLLKEYAKSL